MIFKQHSKLVGQHAFLSASSYHWLNYDEDKLVNTYNNLLAKQRGTELHDFAAQCIRLKQKLPRSQKTLNMFVNDAIGYRMSPEQTLYFSDNCFGTADAIGYDEHEKFLRIHDYKSGTVPAKMEQLKIYAALFCLEYHVSPRDISIELRLYQNDEVEPCNPEPEGIMHIINKIVSFDKIITRLKEEE